MVVFLLLPVIDFTGNIDDLKLAGKKSGIYIACSFLMVCLLETHHHIYQFPQEQFYVKE